MLSLLRRVALVPVALALVLGVAAPTYAAAPTITRQHFVYSFVDSHTGTDVLVHISCDETRIDTGHRAFELIDCQTDDYSQPKVIVFSPTNTFGGYPWFSDFTGQPATNFRIVGTPSGRLFGWASY